jgi:DNA polymerase III subunit alpha
MSRPTGGCSTTPPEGAVDDIGAIPLDDEATYRLYASAKTVAVFQVESSGMMDALRRMKPTCIEDIVALVALYRPGPMENIPDLLRGEERAEAARIDPSLDRPHPGGDARASSSTRNR